MRLPGPLPVGRVVTPMISWLDVAPTLLDLAGLPSVSVEAGLQGHSLLPLIRGETVDGTWPSIYLTECTWMRKRGWRTPDWKLIRALEGDIYGKPSVELYDLHADPAETENLADARADVVASLSVEMEAWVARRMAETGLPDPLIDQADALRIWQPRFIAGKPG
jgi:arylsulfatase A-like enzyme